MSRALGLLVLLLLLLVLVWAVYALIGLGAVAQTEGIVHIAGLTAPVQILRDDRDVPHVVASSDRDLMFGQGFAEASDRLFQMDLLRRFVYGRLAEVMGPAALPADENARVVPIAQIVDAQWAHMTPRERMLVQGFTDGVNAAMQRQQLPVEFHLLVYKPEPWRPQDSLAVGMATVLDLIDRWDDVIRRDAVGHTGNAAPIEDLYSLTDPAYDAPVTSRNVAAMPPLAARAFARTARIVLPPGPDRPAIGSNEWAVGASHSATGHALLANDPHLRLGIPGVWYLVDLRSNDLHVAGGSLPGTPGVILGHNDDIAWGATNGTVVTEVVYRDSLSGANRRPETFHVRLGRDVKYTYFQTRHGFVAQTHGGVAYAVDWNALRRPSSPLSAFIGLDAARSIAEALKALRTYPGPPQNYVIADRSGAAAYHLAGFIPNDPFWGLRVHPGTDPFYPYVAFDRLPHVDAARDARVFTANGRMYGAGYPLRLSPNFEPPYRAKRIEQLLFSKAHLNLADFTAFQADTLSLPERDIARATIIAAQHKHAERDAPLRPYLDALSKWDGRFDPQAHGAPVAWELRRIAAASLAKYNAGSAANAYQASANNANLVLLMRVLRERPRGWWHNSDYDDLLVGALKLAVQTYGTRMLQPWSRYAQVTVQHPLARMGFSFLNGATFPGDGDSFGLHVQTDSHSQSFRAVWDVGNWDAGGMVIPSGESGQPASGHYTDLSDTWKRQRAVPLPFSDSAVRAATRARLTLTPR